MALKLEDLINKKKEPNQILDLSKIKIRSQEELDKYLDKVPEFKIRPEKVRPEDARLRENEFSWKYGGFKKMMFFYQFLKKTCHSFQEGKKDVEKSSLMVIHVLHQCVQFGWKTWPLLTFHGEC
jgi:hypothetical protein